MKTKSDRFKKTTITTEGFVYLTILAFISVGAVLRNVNLLILMAGMMFAPLIINWRLGIHWLNSLSARRTLPHCVHAGQLVNVQWICHNGSKLPVWSLEVRDSIARDLKVAPHINDAEPESVVDDWWQRWNHFLYGNSLPMHTFNSKLEVIQIGGGRSEAATFRVYFTQRGRYRLGPAMIATRFPFSLLHCSILFPRPETMYVAPELGTLTPVWDRRLRSTVVGSDAVLRKRGLEEEEFYALRPWRSGDSRKQIHWRTSAKFNQLIVKQHEQPDNRDFAILLDLCSTPSGGDTNDPECPQCESALSFAATVLRQMGRAVQGKIAMAICGTESIVCRSRNQREMIDNAMRELSIASSSPQPALTVPLLELAAAVSNSTPLYVISSRQNAEEFDFLSPPVSTSDPVGNENAKSVVDRVQAAELRLGRQTVNRLKSVWPNVVWIPVDSAEFQSLFHPGVESDQMELKKFADKWSVDHAAG